MADGFSATKLLDRANRARADNSIASPFQLWELAARYAENRATRALDYGHAMIHAGYLVEKATGAAYLVCPVCEAPLAA